MYKNSRKIPGAYVWHVGVMKRITNQKLDTVQDVIVNNRIRISKSKIKLCRSGDQVTFRNPEILPQRNRHSKPLKIIRFMDNDLVRLSDDDTTHFSHLKKFK